MRMIDGDALKDRLQTLSYDDWNQGVSTTWANAYAECADLVEDMPTIEPEQQWIPCSERLPKIGQSVLLSVAGMYSAEGCLREDGDWAQFRWDTIQRKDMVDAWMPLPEPWKGEQP